MEAQEERIKLTGQLSDSFDQLSADQQNAAIHTLLQFRDDINEGIAKGATHQQIMAGIFRAMEEMYSEAKKKGIFDQVTCSRGCSHCCHIEVRATTPEVQMILEFVKFTGLQLDWDRIKRHSRLNVEERMFDKNSACVFLRDKQCGIYPVRPVACRKYFVENDPELCKASNPDNVASVVMSTYMEILASALYSANVEHDTLEKLLLKHRQ